MISREELDRIKAMAEEFARPARPRSGHQTIALYDRLNDAMMQNLSGLLEAADRGIENRRKGDESAAQVPADAH